MPWTTEHINGSEDSVNVGTVGTIGSLMFRELESIKHTSQASSSSRKKPQTSPVSVPCVSTPKKSPQRRNSFNESGGSNSSGSSGCTDRRSPEKSHKLRHKAQKKGSQVPMLGSNDTTIDRNMNNKRADKKGHHHIVEVVDIKCSNPMSRRLKKLGFSKLSESVG